MGIYISRGGDESVERRWRAGLVKSHTYHPRSPHALSFLTIFYFCLFIYLFIFIIYSLDFISIITWEEINTCHVWDDDNVWSQTLGRICLV